MGYHLTIQRSHLISAEEFASAVAASTELRWEANEKAAAIREGDSACATVRLQDGELWTKGAEPSTIRAMASLADRLGARVFGDDGEWYSSDGEAHVDRAVEAARLLRAHRVQRRRLLWNVVRLGILAATVYLIYLNSR